jgi:hypothetical protein
VPSYRVAEFLPLAKPTSLDLRSATKEPRSRIKLLLWIEIGPYQGTRSLSQIIWQSGSISAERKQFWEPARSAPVSI